MTTFDFNLATTLRRIQTDPEPVLREGAARLARAHAEVCACADAQQKTIRHLRQAADGNPGRGGDTTGLGRAIEAEQVPAANDVEELNRLLVADHDRVMAALAVTVAAIDRAHINRYTARACCPPEGTRCDPDCRACTLLQPIPAGLLRQARHLAGNPAERPTP